MSSEGAPVRVVPWATDYRVHSSGVVESCRNRNGGTSFWRPLKTSGPYPRVTLLANTGKYRRIFVHALVAELFIGPRPSPHHEGDHIDHDTSNNSVDNLRWCTRRQNNCNRPASGVYWDWGRSKWAAKIRTASGKRIGLGRFPTRAEAEAAYRAAAITHHGEFACVS